jgi:hypothetical protein
VVSGVDTGNAVDVVPGMLLHPGGSPAASDASADPTSALALDAFRLCQLLGRATLRPPRWFAPSFGREVALVRAHLAPIRTRESLAGSFGREAFHGLAPGGTDAALANGAVRVAYALRWLELGDGQLRPSWRELLDGAPILR